ncbi:diphthine--ammonia ligase [Candidatus Woesearchaeota archaeon]|jgi:asparagine synthase (glutamine-hydrolysing)|nr:diphthine--ammonia ligase [Candidatus Woesearchaeota archaeon]MBT4835148.1 diphthine--ammonia ligase [Candidatus Woesearchaeota archaeon]MBT6735392.1 diphthine--ammonia ligase [Candidatus Woesearchaeota archaeon]MBT7170084.1 diphthine--ammonia ligase [Candidatus Woesearchaeota archaeon]MBT7474821.1 diphthine--ammonia ligase [Candidatus Woesearchaeota archaeon]
MKTVENLLEKAISKIPKQKVGLLFSGGIDSLALAFYLKKLDYDFTCYTVGTKKSKDIISATKVAEELNLKHEIKIIEEKEVEKYLKKVVPVLRSASPIDVTVGLTTYLASRLAKEDIVISGLGSDEIFGGYSRHKNSKNLNEDLKKGLDRVYNGDLVRDKKIAKALEKEIYAPFLDKDLVEYALSIPHEKKIKKDVNKLILRELLISNGVSQESALRLKKAAQYGTGFDEVLRKLSKKSKEKYLRGFFKVASLYSSGKDSTYSLQLIKEQGYDVNCLVTIKSSNQDSYMYHTPNINLVSLQAEALKLPLLIEKTSGLKEDELKDLERALKKAKAKFGISGVVTGALFSEYQASRIGKICEDLELECFNPLWHKDQATYMKEIISKNYEIIFSSIAADGLTKDWLGRKIIEEDVSDLIKLHSKNGLNVAGEGGEFESLVVDCPLFKKKIKIIDSETKMENEYTGRFLIKKAELE